MSFQIKNTFSCHEDWGKMSPTEKGRFCNACQKEVIDFTILSKSEIVEVFRQNNFQTLCAKAEKSQLETIYIDSNIDNFTVKMPFWQKFLVILLVCFGPEMLNVQVVFSQDSLVEQTEIIKDSIIIEDSVKNENHKRIELNERKVTLKNNNNHSNPGFWGAMTPSHYFESKYFKKSLDDKAKLIEEYNYEFMVRWEETSYPFNTMNAIEKLLFVPLTKETKQKYFDLKGK